MYVSDADKSFMEALDISRQGISKVKETKKKGGIKKKGKECEQSEMSRLVSSIFLLLNQNVKYSNQSIKKDPRGRLSHFRKAP